MRSKDDIAVRRLKRIVKHLERDIAIRDALLRDCIGAGSFEVTIRPGKVGTAGTKVAGLRMLAAIGAIRENPDNVRRKARRGADRLEARVRKLLGIKEDT